LPNLRLKEPHAPPPPPSKTTRVVPILTWYRKKHRHRCSFVVTAKSAGKRAARQGKPPPFESPSKKSIKTGVDYVYTKRHGQAEIRKGELRSLTSRFINASELHVIFLALFGFWGQQLLAPFSRHPALIARQGLAPISPLFTRSCQGRSHSRLGDSEAMSPDGVALRSPGFLSFPRSRA
jgi:hypothetical protein